MVSDGRINKILGEYKGMIRIIHEYPVKPMLLLSDTITKTQWLL